MVPDEPPVQNVRSATGEGMDRQGFQDWLDRYVAAWKSYDRDAIAELWSNDAEYRYHPEDEPVRGREAIVQDWLGEQDEPGRYDGRYEVLAIDGEEHVAMGWSRYYDERGALQDEYWNIYRCQFDGDGRCTLLTEWWIRDREFARRDRAETDPNG
jgi:ketosteroid isomerase-like protein